jgi:hypothetical protein
MASRRAFISSSSINSPSLRCGNSFLHSGTKTNLFREQSQCRISNQILWIGAFSDGNLCKQRFLLGSEIDLHGVRVRKSPTKRKPS